jgi:6-phosphogluconolactonase (cycloisomerase 2 family)
VLAAVIALAAAACSRDVSGPDMPAVLEPAFSSAPYMAGAVYVMTNGSAGNHVLAFKRSPDGTLGASTAYSTGGIGTGGGLGSQGALVLSGNGRWLFAVNAASNDLSVFRIDASGLTLTDREASGGERPISVTSHGSLVYVLNAGGSANIAGFRLSSAGELTALAGSTRPLSADAPNPAQVAFTPAGDRLVVTEKGTNLILTYAVGAGGYASQPTSHPSSGTTPFGFAFAGRATLAVSEAFGGAADASAVSSFSLRGGFSVVSASVGTTETAACWAVATRDGRYVYVTNAGSGTVTGYAVAANGALTLLDADGATGVTGASSSPTDAAVSNNSRYLYVLASGSHEVRAFVVAADGSLSPVNGAAGLPAGSVGIAAR